jgi:DNA helicase-4
MWGRTFTNSSDWSIQLDSPTLTVKTQGKVYRSGLAAVRSVRREAGLVWAKVQVEYGERTISVDGIPNDEAEEMVETISSGIAEALATAIAAISAPLEKWANRLPTMFPADRWIAREDADKALQNAFMQVENGAQLKSFLEHPSSRNAIGRLPKKVRLALELITGGLQSHVEQHNEDFLDTELIRRREFFERIERKPLTEEQARAVVCFDNRLLLVAAAGSGKTSTLVAKAGYAIDRGIVPPEEILMLAFNADAAAELGERIQSRLASVARGSDKILAQTFHALGLSIIGKATGKKPGLAPWIDKDNGAGEIASIIEHLCERDVMFRAKWILYRFVFAEDVGKFDAREEAENWDRRSGKRGFQTHNGEMVKSKEERTIANWLYFHRVKYVYEGKYKLETADADHRQYQPDFYYPEADLYHEHFALDADGSPPPHFANYLEGVNWKRTLHAENGTHLIETSSAELRAGIALTKLAKELASRGVHLKPQDDPLAPGQPVPSNLDLARSFRVFQVHAKSNRLGIGELRKRLSEREGLGLLGRHELFLDLYEQIAEEWQKRLATGNYVDFEDMLNQAADHLEAGRWKSTYRLVLVDEMQDASQARARLIKALVSEPGRYLCAVGDDWQGINRFAGADITTMTHFEEAFGKTTKMFLATTFRCPQSLCDVAGAFITKNPAQISKKVITKNERDATSVICYSVPEESGIAPLVKQHLEHLRNQARSGKVKADGKGPVTVFVLGRYWRNCPLHFEEWQSELAPELRIEYSTIHGSKGREADYVCLVGLSQGSFPSQIEDDPVHQLAMPAVDSFPFSEERRLFYVALTRAKRLVMMYAPENGASEFVLELSGEPHRIPVKRHQSKGEAKVCPTCGVGVLTRRNGRNGAFWGCSQYPACTFTLDGGRRQVRRSTRRV